MTKSRQLKFADKIRIYVSEYCEGFLPIEQARVHAWCCVQCGLSAGFHEEGMLHFGVHPQDSWDFLLTPIPEHLHDSITLVLNQIKDDVRTKSI